MKRLTVGIATDGAHSTKERLTRYRAVDLSSGLELFNHSIGNKTNNIGEFLAIVEAVKYILRHPEAPRIIYSESITAIPLLFAFVREMLDNQRFFLKKFSLFPNLFGQGSPILLMKRSQSHKQTQMYN